MTTAVNPEVVQEIATLVRGVNPIALNQQLEGQSIETCVATFAELQGHAANTIVAMLVCVGQAGAMVEGNGVAAAELAQEFGMSLARFYRCVKAYKEIILTRIARDGDLARWELQDLSWYMLAVDRAKKLSKPALELLEYAEQQVAENPRYSIREFTDDLEDERPNEDEGSTTSLAAVFDRWCAKGSRFEDGVADEWVKWLKASKSPREHLRRAEDAFVMFQQAITRGRQELGA